MKNPKIWALLLVLSCTLSMAACGRSETGSSASITDEKELEKKFAEEDVSEDEETPAQTSRVEKAIAAPDKLSDDIFDFQISIDGTVYQFPMWYSDFEALGWEYDGDPTQMLASNQYSVAEVWKKGDYQIYAEFANMSMNMVPYSECMVAGITLDDFFMQGCDWEILLPGGIEYWKSDRDDIIEAYGEPDDEYDGELYWKLTYEVDFYREVNLYVYKDSNVLKEIEIENLVELEGMDNSIDETVPGIVENYKAPKRLSDDLYDYTVQLEGALYTLPCPVAVLFENGFTIDEENSVSEVGAGDSGWVDLCYNDEIMYVRVANLADYATIVDNCFVVNMHSDLLLQEFDMEIAGNIRAGSSEEDLLEAIEGCQYDVEETEGSTYYEIYDSGENIMDGYTITVDDGVVRRVEIRKFELPK